MTDHPSESTIGHDRVLVIARRTPSPTIRRYLTYAPSQDGSTSMAKGWRSQVRHQVCASGGRWAEPGSATRSRSRNLDRKSTRLNSSHVAISYAVFCLKKKKENVLY